MKFKTMVHEIRRDWKSYIIITLGCFIVAVGFNMFLVPNKIAPGGVSGIATVIYHRFGFPMGITMLIINIPLFIAGFRYLGGAFGIKTFYATIMLSVFVDVSTGLPVLTHDLLLAAIFGGMIIGAGLGLTIYSNSTTGGTDLLAMLLSRLIHGISVGRILLIIDGVVVTFAAISFNNYELGLYAAMTIYLAAKLIDEIVEGADHAKGVYIISAKEQEIAQKLMSRDRGVTALHGRGMYTGTEREVLFCIIRNREIPKVKRVIREIDPEAFVFVTQVSEVLGEGFKPH